MRHGSDFPFDGPGSPDTLKEEKEILGIAVRYLLMSGTALSSQSIAEFLALRINSESDSGKKTVLSRVLNLVKAPDA